MTDLRSAAFARASSGRAPADRPSQRRAVETGGLAVARAPRGLCQIRAAEGESSPLVFEGMASVTGQFYDMWDMFGPYKEQVHVGAFAETLAMDGLDVPLVLDHVSSQRLARTGNPVSPLMLSEVTTGDVTGLRCLAPSLQRDNPWVTQIEPLLRSGLIDEMSFRFTITSGRWNDNFDEFHIHAVDIHRGDVAIVGYGANPLTAGSGLRAAKRSLSVPVVHADDGALRIA